MPLNLTAVGTAFSTSPKTAAGIDYRRGTKMSMKPRRSSYIDDETYLASKRLMDEHRGEYGGILMVIAAVSKALTHAVKNGAISRSL